MVRLGRFAPWRTRGGPVAVPWRTRRTSTHDTSAARTWHICGTHMAHVRRTPMPHPRQTHGASGILRSHGIAVTVPMSHRRRTHTTSMPYPWQSHCGCHDTSIHGRCAHPMAAAVPWHAHGGFMVHLVAYQWRTQGIPTAHTSHICCTTKAYKAILEADLSDTHHGAMAEPSHTHGRRPHGSRFVAEPIPNTNSTPIAHPCNTHGTPIAHP